MICLLLAGAVPAAAAKKSSLQIGFVGAPPPGFQNVLLNVVAVRVNPKVGAGPNAGGWQKIPAPPGISSNGSNAELQIDLNSSQNVPQLFNSANVRTDTYKIIELQLDLGNPGTLIPNCPASPPADGCINYPLQINNPNGITFSNPDGAVLITTKTGTLSQFVLQLGLTINSFPTGPGGAYTATVTITPLSTAATGIINGTVTMGAGSGGGTNAKTRKLTVSAETIGTNTVISTAPVKSGQQFTLILPAAGPPPPSSAPFGTLYDLAVSGGAATYGALRLPPLFPGTTMALPTTLKGLNVVGNQTLGNITGTVKDGCTTKTISGATLQLLIPPNGSTNTALCMSPATADQCVSVATANTDNAGDFPLPGTLTVPPAFGNVPTLPKSSKGYAMEVTAPGYDPLFVQALPGTSGNKKAGGTCSTDGGTTFTACVLRLNTGYIAGSIPIIPPNPGQTVMVQVLAEDHGTNNIESALPMPITIGSNPSNTSVNFSLNVPPSIPIGSFDLFASTIDHYQGVVDPYQGHTIVPISHVAAPSACATVTAPTPTAPSQVITCVGHGSITGSVANPNLGSSVVLEKIDPDAPPGDDNPEVQITNSLVQNQAGGPNPNPSSNYAFCTPADTYQVQEFQLPQPAASETPIAAASPSPVAGSDATVTIPPPPIAGGASPTPTPGLKCPTNCSFQGSNTCPGICKNVVQQLPPGSAALEAPASAPTL